MKCTDYRSQRSCERDNCHAGDCEWNPTFDDLGIGVCIDKQRNNCKECGKVNKDLGNADAFSDVWDYCREEATAALSTDDYPCFYDKDIKKINQGKYAVYQTGDWGTNRKDFFTKYALVLSIIPILPPWLVDRISKSERAVNFFSRLPLYLIPIIKIIVNFRSGRGFLPLAILRMEIFFTTQFQYLLLYNNCLPFLLKFKFVVFNRKV